MDRWIKIKESELKVLLRLSKERISKEILCDQERYIEASHILRINENKIKK
jgi:hypothetical protein